MASASAGIVILICYLKIAVRAAEMYKVQNDFE
jgi:hypothetical protein